MPICYTHLLRPLVVQMYGVCKCAETGGISEAVLWYKDSSKAVLLSVFSSQLMYCIYASMLHHQTTHSIHSYHGLPTSGRNYSLFILFLFVRKHLYVLEGDI